MMDIGKTGAKKYEYKVLNFEIYFIFLGSNKIT